MTEEWREIPIPGGEWYEASNLGFIRSWRSKGHLANNKAKNPRILSMSTWVAGYKCVCIKQPDKKRIWLVHRLIALTFLGLRPDGYCVDHMNQDKSNNAVTNLRYISLGENTARSLRKLSTEQTRLVRESNLRPSELGKQLGVSAWVVNSIRSGHSYIREVN